MKIKKVFFAFLMLPILLVGSLLEISKFKDILDLVEEHSSKKILIVCDIDNTLLRASQHSGSVAWGDYLIAQLELKGISKQQAEEVESIFWKAIQPYVKVETVDPETPAIIREIQNRKISILGLTARAPDEIDYTTKQLLSLDINLSSHEQNLSISERLRMGKYDALYDQGILFSTPFNKKSNVLFHFLKKHEFFPECIIFVDDKWSHVEDVEKACNEENIACIGIRINAADEHVKNFNPHLAEIQWQAFPLMLSDEQAQQRLQVTLNP